MKAGIWDDNQPSYDHCDPHCVEERCLQVRGNDRWNDESCSDGSSFWCYAPDACLACYNGPCSAWHDRRACEPSQDSICVACVGTVCGIGQTANPAGGCGCVDCGLGATYKSSTGTHTCTGCTTGTCGIWDSRSECTPSALISSACRVVGRAAKDTLRTRVKSVYALLVRQVHINRQMEFKCARLARQEPVVIGSIVPSAPLSAISSAWIVKIRVLLGRLHMRIQSVDATCVR